MVVSSQTAASAGRLHISRAAYKRYFRFALILSDGLMLILAFAAAYWLRFDIQFGFATDATPSFIHYARLVLILIPALLGLFALHKLYNFHYLLGGTAEYARAFNACTTGMMLVVVASFLEPTFVVARAWLILAWLLSIGFVLGARFGLRRLAYALRSKGLFTVPAVIVGTNGEANALIEQWQGGQSAGMQIVGIIDDGAGKNQRFIHGLPVLGDLDSLANVVRGWDVEEVIVATSAMHRTQMLDLFQKVSQLPGVEMRLSSGLYEVLTTGVEVRTIGSVPLLSLNRLRLDPLEALLKTALDYTLTVLGVLGLLPVFAIIALLVKLDSPGPVLHRRRVLGVGGKPFDALKFRTMVVNGEEVLEQHPHLKAELANNHKLKDDPRVTRLGKFLRRTSLDELPQLFNILRGQMSLVGPRMITLPEAEMYGLKRWNLLTVKPGLTGLWQVSGRSDVSYDERVRLDMHYIRNYNIWLDLQILFVQTLPAVLKKDGAY